jgi:hypothetical protein
MSQLAPFKHGRARGTRIPRWRAGLAALAGLTVLTAVGCSTSTPSPSITSTPVPTPTSTSVTTVNPAAEPSGLGAQSGVTGGALFGGDVPLVSQQGSLGRTLAIVRDYYRIGQSFPDATDRSIMARGSTMLISLDTVPPKGPTYAEIASGKEDGTILRFLQAMEQAAVTYHLGAIYICFEHEADTAPHHRGLGSPAEFVSAWDHVHQLAVNAHLDWNQGGRLHWVLILTSEAYRKGIAGEFWPGSSEVDIVAADGYNTGDCRTAAAGTNIIDTGRKFKTPAQIFAPVIGYAYSRGRLPVFIAEWASVPYSSSAVQPAFIHQMQQYVQGNREIAAALYWNGHGQGNGCDYIIDNVGPSLSALATMAHSAGLQGRVMSPN